MNAALIAAMQLILGQSRRKKQEPEVYIDPGIAAQIAEKNRKGIEEIERIGKEQGLWSAMNYAANYGKKQ